MGTVLVCHNENPWRATLSMAPSTNRMRMRMGMGIRKENVSFSKATFETFLLASQQSICQQLEGVDGSGKGFCYDKWQRGQDSQNGYGITRVLEGDTLEKAAVNVSIINGQLSETRAKTMTARGRVVEPNMDYFAGALSLVIHPRSPYIPTFRSDIRYFEVDGNRGWFGGGADLTPCYLDYDEATCFHAFWKKICDQYHPNLYSSCKSACDSYFYLPSRKEHRGIGGIFFDDLEEFENNFKHEDCRSEVFDFVRQVAEGFMSSYLPIIKKKKDLMYGDKERLWQLQRRGRYLEFNLLYDRGIKFGLDGGRIESIMVSAPPLVAWNYNVTSEPNSPEAHLLEVLRCPRDWV